VRQKNHELIEFMETMNSEVPKNFNVCHDLLKFFTVATLLSKSTNFWCSTVQNNLRWPPSLTD